MGVVKVLGCVGVVVALVMMAKGAEEPQDTTMGPESVQGYYDTREWKAVGEFTPSLPLGETEARAGAGEGGQPPRRRRGRRRKAGARRPGGRRRRPRPYLPVLDTNTELPGPAEDTYSVAPFTDVEGEGVGEGVGQGEGQGEGGLLEPHTAQTEDQDQGEPPRRDKSYRRAYSRAKKKEMREEHEAGGLTDLKALLKQSGGLSLSELLQRKNLSLADFLTGHHQAKDLLEPTEIIQDDQPISINEYSDTLQRRLPTVNTLREKVVEIEDEETPTQTRLPAQREENTRRRPAARRTKYTQQMTQLTTSFTPRKSLNDNIIRRRLEEPTASDEQSTDIPTDFKNLVDPDEEIVTTTTTSAPTKSSRLSLKPRLRLPTVKAAPRRILKPEMPASNATDTNNKARKTNLPTQAIPIDVKDLFGIANITTTSTTTAKPTVKPKYEPTKSRRIYTATTQPTVQTTKYTRTSKTKLVNVITATTDVPPSVGPSAKDEILEVLTDIKGGERLTRVLAARNMSLGELVAQRERGSSQLHLADIFPNSSLSPSVSEPFLSKSMIAPISRQIYPLKALLEGNMGKNPTVPSPDNYRVPPFVDKSSQSEENLGIVTLFDKFSGFGGIPNALDPKDIKKDSDGSSYFTSVINVKPTDEIYRESRDSFQDSHKQVSQIFSSLPTYIKAEEILEINVSPDWNPPHHEHSMLRPDSQQLPGESEGLRPEEEHLIVVGSSLGEEEASQEDGEGEGLYSRLPVAVKSAIMVSSCIAGMSLLVFLSILVACRLRQRRRTLHYSEGRPSQLASSRSISPILLGAGGTNEPQYLWESSRHKPFQ